MEQECMNTAFQSAQGNDISTLVEELLRKDLYMALKRVNIKDDIVSCLPPQLYLTQIDMDGLMNEW